MMRHSEMLANAYLRVPGRYQMLSLRDRAHARVIREKPCHHHATKDTRSGNVLWGTKNGARGIRSFGSCLLA
jgi:hypothetical protein